MKVLLVTNNSFHKHRNNGKTLESLFSKFSKDELAQLFFSQNEEPDWDFCETYYQLTDTDVLRNLLGRHHSGILKHNAQEMANRRSRLFPILKSLFKKSYFGRSILWRFWENDDLYKWIDDIKPDVLFFLAGNLSFSYNIALKLSTKYSLPVVVYFTDDYCIYPQYKMFTDYMYKRLIYRKCKDIVNASSLSLGIGELMCKVYEKEFHKKFIPAMNSVELLPYEKKISRFNTLQIAYVGSLHLGREDSIVAFSQIFRSVMMELNKSFVFRIYTTSVLNNKNKRLLEENGVELMQPVFGEQLNEVLASSDILLHIESPNKYYSSFARLSVSTKIPEYLSMGRFILGYGPSFLSSFRLLSDKEIGGVVPCELLFSEQKRILKEFILNDGYREACAARGWEYCNLNYDIQKNGNKVRAYIQSLCNS